MQDICPYCGTPKVSPTSKYCTNCRKKFEEARIAPQNYCLNPKCPRCISGYKFDISAVVCDECGGETTVGRQS